ncbi:hypothetical protein FXF51_09980 [Nonomuraea sp. PA05]|uniref:hypothetical protein n=1 Tax=Nonomuraea sp. PA05 TaxID=2604466 RepID=UPI0011D6EA35|nr:hypothetical protein [Nonomuraea sp. PA05]TYB68830.1 hypothetical protein FXF51_09980 [Nonomuraea sp. PA05]
MEVESSICLSDLVPALRWSRPQQVAEALGDPRLPAGWWSSVALSRALGTAGLDWICERLARLASSRWDHLPLADLLPALTVHHIDPSLPGWPEATRTAIAGLGGWQRLRRLSPSDLTTPSATPEVVMGSVFREILGRIPAQREAPAAVQGGHPEVTRPLQVGQSPAGTGAFPAPVARQTGSFPAASPERPASPADRPASPADRPVAPADRPVSPADRPIAAADRPVAPAERQSGPFPVTPAERQSGPFPVTPAERQSGPFPVTPAADATPGARQTGPFPGAAPQPGDRQTGSFPAVPGDRQTGPFPGDRQTGSFPAVPSDRQTGSFPAVPGDRQTGSFPAVPPERQTGSFPAQPQGGGLPQRPAAPGQQERLPQRPTGPQSGPLPTRPGTPATPGSNTGAPGSRPTGSPIPGSPASGGPHTGSIPPIPGGPIPPGAADPAKSTPSYATPAPSDTDHAMVRVVDSLFRSLDKLELAVAVHRLFAEDPVSLRTLAHKMLVERESLSQAQRTAEERVLQWLRSSESAPVTGHMFRLTEWLGAAATEEQLIGADPAHPVMVPSLRTPLWRVLVTLMPDRRLQDGWLVVGDMYGLQARTRQLLATSPQDADVVELMGELGIRAHSAKAWLDALPAESASAPAAAASSPAQPLPRRTPGANGHHHRGGQPVPSATAGSIDPSAALATLSALSGGRSPMLPTGGLAGAPSTPPPPLPSPSSDPRRWQRIEVTPEHLRGGPVAVPEGYAAQLGMRPGTLLSVTGPGDNAIVLVWQGHQPVFDSLQPVLMRLNARPGDQVYVTVDGYRLEAQLTA